MAEALTGIAPAIWRITATTIHCEMVDDQVTIMVNGDWSCKCTWWDKYKRIAGEEPGRKFTKVIKQKIPKCQGPDCRYVIGYRDRLIGEEKATKE